MRLTVGLLLLAMPVSAQSVGGLVLSPSGDPVAGAAVTFWPRPQTGPRWLHDRAAGARALETHTTVSGRYALRTEEPGALWFEHVSGLGALLLDVAPGAPDRAQLEPMGEVHIAEAEGEIRTHVGAIAGGVRHHLGTRRGHSFRMPPATYRLLIQRDGHWTTARCRVGAGQSVRIAGPGQSRRVTLADDFQGRVVLPGWPHVDLLQDGTVPIPAADQPVALIAIRESREERWFAELWLQPGQDELTIPEPAWAKTSLQITGPDGPVSGAFVASFDAGFPEPRLLSETRTDEDGRARRAATSKNCYVLIHAAGLGYHVASAADLDEEPRVELRAGHTVSVAVRELAREVSAATVTLRHDDHPALVFSHRTDRRGRVEFRDQPAGSATLELESHRHLPATAPVQVGPGRTHRDIEAHPGATLRGTVTMADGKPVDGALVRLWDPAGGDLSSRTEISDGLGQFSFAGLPVDELFALSAEKQAAGKTWSAQVRGVQPGTGEWTLELALEDPTPPHRR